MQSADEVFAHVVTNCGHPVGAAVALENIAVIEEQGLMRRVRDEIGPYFGARLQELLQLPCVGEVQSFGVFGRIEMNASRGGRTASQEEHDALLDKVVDIAWKRGLATKGGGFCLPMIITREQIDEAVNILEASIAEAAMGVS